MRAAEPQKAAPLVSANGAVALGKTTEWELAFCVPL